MAFKTVTIVVLSLSPQLGGGYTGILNLAKCLSDNGTVDVTILTLEKTPRTYYIQGIKVLCLPFFLHKRIPSLRFFFSIPLLLNTDLLYIHSFNSPLSLLAYLCSFWRKTTILFRPHGSIMHTYTTKIGLLQRFLLQLQALIYSQFSTFVFSSTLESQQSLCFLSTFCKTIPSVIIPEPFYPTPQSSQSHHSKAISLLYVGRIVPSKGIVQFLFELLKHFQTKQLTLSYPASIVLAGMATPAITSDLLYLADSFAHHNIFVEYRGFVSNHERDTLLHSSQYFLHPTSGDCFGISVLEAVFAGCHVLSTTQLGISKDLYRARALTYLLNTSVVINILLQHTNPPSADLPYLTSVFHPDRVFKLYQAHFSK